MAAAPNPARIIYKGPSAQIGAVALDAERGHLAAVDWKGAVTLWRLGDAKPLWSTRISTHRVFAVGFLDRRVVATTVDGRVVVLDAERGDALAGAAELSTVNGHDVLHAAHGRVLFMGMGAHQGYATTALDAEGLAVAWQRARDELVAGVHGRTVFLADRVSVDPLRWVLRGVDLVTGAELFERPCGDTRPWCVHGPSGQIATLEQGRFEMRSLDAPEVSTRAVMLPNTELQPGSVSPDGKTVAVQNGKSVVFVDVETGATRASATRHTEHLASMVWAPDGKTLLSGGWDRVVRVHVAG